MENENEPAIVERRKNDDRIKERYQLCDLDLDKFVRYGQKNEEMSESTMTQYLGYLSYINFDPVKNSDKLENFSDWYRNELNPAFKKEDRNAKKRQKYTIALALKKYLEAIGHSDLKEKLPKLNPPKSKPPEIRYNENQVRKIIDKAETDQLRLSIIFMFYSGLRTYEVLNLTPEWLEFKEKQIEIKIPGKYAKGRKGDPRPEYAFLPAKYEKELKDYIRMHYDTDESYRALYKQLVGGERSFKPIFNFIEETEKTLQDLQKERYYLRKQLENAAENSGINDSDKISPHKLRKSFIHHTYDQLNDLNRTSHLARHRSPETTAKRYLNLGLEDMREDYSTVFSEDDSEDD